MNIRREVKKIYRANQYLQGEKELKQNQLHLAGEQKVSRDVSNSSNINRGLRDKVVNKSGECNLKQSGICTALVIYVRNLLNEQYCQ